MNEDQEPVAWTKVEALEAMTENEGSWIWKYDPSRPVESDDVFLYLHPSAEIAALRERIAGMEKDAARWRIAREFEYVTDFEVLGIDQRIDAGFAKEKQP